MPVAPHNILYYTPYMQRLPHFSPRNENSCQNIVRIDAWGVTTEVCNVFLGLPSCLPNLLGLP